jgi:hypothetical protein
MCNLQKVGGTFNNNIYRYIFPTAITTSGGLSVIKMAKKSVTLLTQNERTYCGLILMP